MFFLSRIFSCCFFIFSVFPAAAQVTHPSLVLANLTDLGYIEEVSKFRSGAGHEFYYHPFMPGGATDVTEPPSSMKHYFSPYSDYRQEHGNQVTVPVYAPFSGEIIRVTNEGEGAIINKRVEIQSSINPAYTIIIFHIDLDDAYPQIYNDWPIELWPAHLPDDTSYITRTVVAGEFIGYADMRDSHDFDVAVSWLDSNSERYWISYFSLLSPQVLSEYSERGAEASDFIISKAERLVEPVTWWEGRNDEDWISLNAEFRIPMPIWASLVLGFLLCFSSWRVVRRC